MRSEARVCRRAICGACALAALALGACASLPSANPVDWFRARPSGPQPAELPPLARAQPMRVLWTASVGPSEGYILAPALAGDSVYAAARDGTVVRLDAASGALRWRAATGMRISGAVGADGEIVVVASESGEVLALDAADGKARWRTRVSSEVLAPPRLADGLVLVRSADSRIFAFGAHDGRRRWVYQRSPAALVVRSPAGVSVHEDSAYAGFPGGKLVALSLANGGARWEATVALPRGATELERIVDVVGEPAVFGREVCAVAYQGRVACYDARNGIARWARELSSLSGVALDARHAYVSDDKGTVHALERASGRSLWRQERLAHRQLSTPLALGAAIAVGDLQGYVHLLAHDSGAFIARHATDGGAIRAAPLRLPAGFLVQTAAGGLYALAPAAP
jgi:outer membrane protein assembly factor BamB